MVQNSERMKYNLINSVTGEKTLCEKVTLGGFDHYFIIKNVTDSLNFKPYYHVYDGTLCKRAFTPMMGDKEVIATTNPNLDIPKVVDVVEILAEKRYGIERNEVPDWKEWISNDDFYKIKGFIDGYNKSQQTHHYSKEDMLDFLDWCSSKYQPFMDRFILSSGNGDFEDPYTTEQPWFTLEELFQLWEEQRPKKVYYE